MVNVDEGCFGSDIALVPISVGYLFSVLLGVSFAQSTDLETGVSGLAVVICTVATAASLLVLFIYLCLKTPADEGAHTT
jgi:ABC-type proline/glycine betaine transport system permease subunit